VFLPHNKSFVDTIILQYINVLQDLEFGYFFSSLEDDWGLRLSTQIYKYIGMYLPQRDQKHNHSINYVNQALFEETIINNPITFLY